MTSQACALSISDQLPVAFLAELRLIEGIDVSTAQAVRDQHGTDESAVPTMAPDAVVYVHSTEQVAEVVKLCAHYKVPMVPFGTGTSLEGQLQATRAGICIDVSRMNQVLTIRESDLDVTLQPGVTRKQLNNALHGTGLFFPIDPGADASIGGMAATRASGTNAVRYGTMRENILSLTVVLPNGEVVRTSGRARKSAAGYDLTRLFIGSAGTLGVITELTVKVHPLPESVSAAVCTFPSVKDATQAVIDAIQMGIPLARIELLDALSIHAINLFSKTVLPEQPSLFFEFHGSEAAVKEQIDVVQEIATSHGAENFDWANRPEDRTRLWQARHDAYYASLALRPGMKAITTDVVVPISRLSECIELTIADFERLGLTAPILGHVGDGNFHAIILIDPDNADEVNKANQASEDLAMRAIAMEGSCTGEHGIGLAKQKFMKAEFGVAGCEAMAMIKMAMDPHNIMNPDKIVPSTITARIRGNTSV